MKIPQEHIDILQKACDDIFTKPSRVFERKDVPDWYLRINDMIADSPLMKEIREGKS